MSKVISYSLFGYGRQPSQGSFEFNTYMRGMWTNMRVNRVIYPDWKMVVNVDHNTFKGEYRPVFDWMIGNGVEFASRNDASLCVSMLWRTGPIFEIENGDHKYTHVLCRDIDSITTYREAQMVQEWINEDKTIHCITDSISHNIPMMGGMIGFRPGHFMARSGVRSFDQLMNIARDSRIDFNRKGSDQDFLNRYIYPNHADSATEHFILGMKHTVPEGGGRHYRVPDIELQGVDPEQKCTNDLAGHVGAAGCYEPVMVRWLNTMDPYRDEYAEIERQFPKLFFWRQ